MKVSDVSLYCGFPGTEASSLLFEELDFLDNYNYDEDDDDDYDYDDVLSKRDLAEDNIDCNGRPVDEFATLFDLMVDGEVFFEVTLNKTSRSSSQREDDITYLRGQIYL